MRLLRLSALCSFAMAAAIFLPAVASATWYTQSNPIDSSQLLKMPWNARSYWLQPWRSSLTTRPASWLQNAIGINFNVTPTEAPSVAQLLGDSGFRRARLEIPWSAMSYTDPTQVANPSYWATDIQAMRSHNIRPLILLNSNSGSPTPELTLNLTLAAPAAAGSRTVVLNPSSVSQVVPGLTGLNPTINGSWYAAQFLITSMAGDVATLSQPLTVSLPAGPVSARTILYQPFSSPFLADGTTPNPRYQATLRGWLAYVKAVCDLVRDNLGSDNFDVEIWNELSFGSQFLVESNYYSPLPDPGSTGSITNALVADTLQMLRDPQNGLTDVKVGDGFTNQSPFGSGSSVPAGTDAIDKHPYQNGYDFSPGTSIEPQSMLVDASARPSSIQTTSSAGAVSFQDTFTPTFRAFMPEFYLTGFKTETMMRDLSPYTETYAGATHGATVHPAGAAAPTTWITEANLDQGVGQAAGMSPSELQELQAKAALRYYTAFASAGVQAVDLYGAKDLTGHWGIIPASFYTAADADPSTYPGDGAGGSTTQAVGRMVSTLSGTAPITTPRQLGLAAVASDDDTDVQFSGDGTASHPSLYNRNMLTFFPFQVTDHKFVSAIYVMSTDLTHLYTNFPAPGQTPYDMPPENFQLSITGVDAAAATVSLFDPLTDSSDPVNVVSRAGDEIVVQLQATDSVRMLTIDDGASGTGSVGPTDPASTTTSQPAPPTVTADPTGIATITTPGRTTPTTGSTTGTHGSPTGTSAKTAHVLLAAGTVRRTDLTGGVPLTLETTVSGRVHLVLRVKLHRKMTTLASVTLATTAERALKITVGLRRGPRLQLLNSPATRLFATAALGPSARTSRVIRVV